MPFDHVGSTYQMVVCDEYRWKQCNATVQRTGPCKSPVCLCARDFCTQCTVHRSQIAVNV